MPVKYNDYGRNYCQRDSILRKGKTKTHDGAEVRVDAKKRGASTLPKETNNILIVHSCQDMVGKLWWEKYG